jgi:penicillin-binding protein 2
VGKSKQFEDNAWFVGYAPRRNPEIVVSVLVQESGKHGGESAGPVVRDILKAYYDKKNKKTQGQFTTENQDAAPKKAPVPVAAIAPRTALKPEDSSAHVSNPVEQR